MLLNKLYLQSLPQILFIMKIVALLKKIFTPLFIKHKVNYEYLFAHLSFSIYFFLVKNHISFSAVAGLKKHETKKFFIQ